MIQIKNNTSHPTVSVIIPVYNEEKYIGDCLQSIMRQTEKPDEIILVDNNSTDDTVSIAKNFPVRIIHEKKQGMIPARNCGFNAAKNDILARTDADTTVPPTWIAMIKRHFRKKNVVGLAGPAKFGKNANPELTSMLFAVNKLVLNHYALYGPNMSIRKSAWEKVKNEICLDENEIHEDLDLGIHLSKYGMLVYDKKLVVSTSARRMKKPKSLFIDYLVKWAKTFKSHSEFITLKM